MYHAIVRARIRSLFRSVSQGDADPVINGFARKFEHAFLGEHALGGKRHTKESTQAWYDRLYRLLPDISFEIRRMWISGAPWNTVVIVEWDETNSGADGVRTQNHGIHAVHLRWGRMTQLFICPDTEGLVATLHRLAAAGVTEAAAAPIED